MSLPLPPPLPPLRLYSNDEDNPTTAPVQTTSLAAQMEEDVAEARDILGGILKQRANTPLALEQANVQTELGTCTYHIFFPGFYVRRAELGSIILQQLQSVAIFRRLLTIYCPLPLGLAAIGIEFFVHHCCFLPFVVLVETLIIKMLYTRTTSESVPQSLFTVVSANLSTPAATNHPANTHPCSTTRELDTRYSSEKKTQHRKNTHQN